MKLLFDNPEVLLQGRNYVVIEESFITYVGKTRPEGVFDRTIDGRDLLLIPGLYNCHTHAAMTLFRGYGEDLPLQEWLSDRIFPAEELLTSEAVYHASMLACAEMIRNGIVSFTDMYNFNEETIRAVAETGMKANISRAILSFDDEVALNERFAEGKQLFRDYHNSYGGRIRIDMSLHAEYTNRFSMAVAAADFARENKTGVHVHLSETEREHQECMQRHEGKTPARFFLEAGIFDSPTTAAHCVWVTDEDIAIMAEKGVSAAHNPVSNLKLGSGVMPLGKMLDAGVNVTLGTDGCASNNTLDILKEMYLCAILHKGMQRRPDKFRAEEILSLASENGARAQGREHSGKIAAGYSADIAALRLSDLNMIPYYDTAYAALYSANSSNVCLTMADGKILYENGEYNFIDIEKIKADMRDTCANYFQK